MGTYAFADVLGAIEGPGGVISFGGGDAAGVASEGITVAMNEDKGSMVNGADGSYMHSLHAAKGGTITVRTLKTSALNAQLSEMYNYQTGSSSYYGRSSITVRNVVTGDVTVARGCAFRKLPDNVSAVEGGTMEWVFNCGMIDQKLGSGDPTIDGFR